MDHDALRRFHSFTGLVPLGAYLAFHAWEQWPVRAGRDAVLERIDQTSAAPFEIVVVLLPLLAHAFAGLRLWGLPDSSRAYASPAFRRLQAATGILALGFITFHVVGVWVPRALGSGSSLDAYAAMLRHVGTVPGAALYTVGLSAVCIHLGQGLSAAWIRHGGDVPISLARTVGVLLALAIWLALLDALSAYAAGGALL